MADEQESRAGWVVVVGCFGALAVIFGASYSFAALFEPLQREFNATRADVSWVFGVSGLIYFALGAAAGLATERFGPRLVTSAGMVCIAAGLWASSLARELSVVTAAFGLGVGVGVGLVYAPAVACVQPWFTRRRGLASGIASAGIGAGTLLVPLLAAWLITRADWRSALQVLAVGVLVLGLASTLLLRRAPVPAGTVAPGLTLREALKSSAFRRLYGMCLLAGAGMFVPFAHVSAAARDAGIDEVRAVGLVGVIGIGSLIGRFAIGALADRLGRLRTLVAMELSLAASYLLWAGASGYPAYSMFALFALWMGLSYGGMVSLMPALCMDLFGARALSSIIGVLYTGAGFGNLAGPVLAGWAFDSSGSYAAVIVVCFVLLLASAWVTWGIRPAASAGVTVRS